MRFGYFTAEASVQWRAQLFVHEGLNDNKGSARIDGGVGGVQPP